MMEFSDDLIRACEDILVNFLGGTVYFSLVLNKRQFLEAFISDFCLDCTLVR